MLKCLWATNSLFLTCSTHFLIHFLNTRLLHLHKQTNQKISIGEMHYLSFGFKGGQTSSLMHVADDNPCQVRWFYCLFQQKTNRIWPTKCTCCYVHCGLFILLKFLISVNQGLFSLLIWIHLVDKNMMILISCSASHLLLHCFDFDIINHY